MEHDVEKSIREREAVSHMEQMCQAKVNDWLGRRVDEAFADPRPNVSARKQFGEHHAKSREGRRSAKM